MRIWLDLPDDVVEHCTPRGRISRALPWKLLAIDAYRMNRITAHQMCRVLGIPSGTSSTAFSSITAFRFEYSLADFDDEASGSPRLWQKRRGELESERNRNRHAE